MIFSIFSILVCASQILCSESIFERLNKFTHDVNYETYAVKRDLITLTNYNKKSLALSIVDKATTRHHLQYAQKHATTASQYLFRLSLYPSINYCLDALMAIKENIACSNLLNSHCPQIFQITNELYWHILRSQNPLLHNLLLSCSSMGILYLFMKEAREHRNWHRCVTTSLSSIRYKIEMTQPLSDSNFLPFYYTPVLIADLHIHNHNFNHIWFIKKLRQTIEALNSYDHRLAVESVGIIKNNLEQDRRNQIYFCAGLTCFLMLFSYTQAIITFLSGEEPSTYNHYFQEGHSYNLYGMVPFSPIIFYILSAEATAPINHKLDVLSRFEKSLLNI